MKRISNDIAAYMVVTRRSCCALHTWYLSQLSGPHSHDQCGIDQNDQRRNRATEELLQACREMWGDQ